MRRLNICPPALLRGMGMAATVIALVGWGNWSSAKAATAQPVALKPVNIENAGPARVDLLDSRFCPSDLEVAIASIINNARFDSARWGISIESLSDQTALYRHNSDTSLIPASNIKLLTTAAALQIVSDRSPQDLFNLESWITVVNRDSHNAYADDLLRRVGGQHAVQQALTPLGIDPDSYEQVDGSGLSRQNRATPTAFVTLLKSMHAHNERDLFYRSLPVAGVSGTLRNRFRATSIQGRLHAKTGTLRGVRALSGYLETPNYGTVALSILINQSGQSGQVMLGAIDQIVQQTARVAPCD